MQRRKRGAERRRDVSRNVLLNNKHVAEFAVVDFGPTRRAGRRIDQVAGTRTRSPE